MDNQQQIRYRWLLMARGICYILLGVSMFIYANTFTPGTALILGVVTLLAGVAGGAYARMNSRIDPNNFWTILHSLNDLIFGVVFLVTANNGLKNFVDMLGFWAVVYAFLQAVRAMYAALMEGGSSFFNRLSHFISVAVAGYLAFDILMRPVGLIDSLGIMGFFPILLGIIVIVQARLSAEKPVSTVQ